MTVKYIENLDILYINFAEEQVTCSQPEENPSIILELGKDERLAGIEVLDASKNFANLDAFLASVPHTRVHEDAASVSS